MPKQTDLRPRSSLKQTLVYDPNSGKAKLPLSPETKNSIHPSKRNVLMNLEEWKPLFEKIRDIAVENSSVFGKYTPFSNETYGELEPVLVNEIIRR